MDALFQGGQTYVEGTGGAEIVTVEDEAGVHKMANWCECSWIERFGGFC
jgi:hypothetical protein